MGSGNVAAGVSEPEKMVPTYANCVRKQEAYRL